MFPATIASDKFTESRRSPRKLKETEMGKTVYDLCVEAGLKMSKRRRKRFQTKSQKRSRSRAKRRYQYRRPSFLTSASRNEKRVTRNETTDLSLAFSLKLRYNYPYGKSRHYQKH
jgi:hypothetical protein